MSRFVWQLEKMKSLLSRAKYGCASVSNPVSALQRDSDVNNDMSYDDASVRAMCSDQLAQLENLITKQHVCQRQMRDQLIAVEKQYHSVTNSTHSDPTHRHPSSFVCRITLKVVDGLWWNFQGKFISALKVIRFWAPTPRWKGPTRLAKFFINYATGVMMHWVTISKGWC